MLDEVTTDAWSAAVRWARSGAMALTGWPADEPLLPPMPIPAKLDALAVEVEALAARRGHPVRIDWATALSGRARLLGLVRGGRISANGSCRMLRTADGWVALSLPRTDDWEMLPALTLSEMSRSWDDVEVAAKAASATSFVAQARLLGLACSEVVLDTSAPATAPWVTTQLWAGDPVVRRRSLIVVDLSALWAGPVVARVLRQSGARIVKVESVHRPDSARTRPDFYRWVHAPDESSVTVDLHQAADRASVATLLEHADVVIESSRPRALEQLGFGPRDVPPRAGRVWLSITGHGRAEPAQDWVAFGDDAAAGGGIVAFDRDGAPTFCADAIADPLTGLVGALAVLRSLEGGGGDLIDLSMRAASASLRSGPRWPVGADAVVVEADGAGSWRIRCGSAVEPVAVGPPSAEWIRSA